MDLVDTFEYFRDIARKYDIVVVTAQQRYASPPNPAWIPETDILVIDYIGLLT